MLKKSSADIFAASAEQGWVLEPDTKHLLAAEGIDVPRFSWATREAEAVFFAQQIGYPVVAKIVSYRVVHKSDQGGVAVGVDSDEKLAAVFRRFAAIEGFAGLLVEEMIAGIELIVGSKTDHQFGPVILLGIGGTGVELYQDVSVRMAPLEPRDIDSMIRGLKARQYLTGFRGTDPVNTGRLSRLLITFSRLAMKWQERVDSIDLNPVICSAERCTVADARIILKPAAPE